MIDNIADVWGAGDNNHSIPLMGSEEDMRRVVANNPYAWLLEPRQIDPELRRQYIQEANK